VLSYVTASLAMFGTRSLPRVIAAMVLMLVVITVISFIAIFGSDEHARRARKSSRCS
jgi:hypothetical protein